MAQARLGHYVAIAGMRIAAPCADAVDAAVRMLSWEPRWRSASLRMLLPSSSVLEPDRIQDFNPDIVHVHGELNPDNIIAAKLFDCPLVLSPHGGFHPAVFHRGRAALKRVFFQLNRLRFYRRAAIHAVSPIEAQYTARLLPKQSIYCVHQGPGHCMAPFREPEMRTRDRVSFVFVGRLNTLEKGLDILLDAFADAVRRSQKDLALTLVGPDFHGSLRDLRRRCEDLGITNRVVFAGRCGPEEISRLLRDADVYVQLSRLEGFGLSVAEALLAGLPAILSNAIGAMSFRELYDLPHVCLVDPDAKQAAEAMLAYIPRHAYLRQIAASYQGRIRSFLSWDHAAKRHLEEYRKMQCPAPATLPALHPAMQTVAALPR